MIHGIGSIGLASRARRIAPRTPAASSLASFIQPPISPRALLSGTPSSVRSLGPSAQSSCFELAKAALSGGPVDAAASFIALAINESLFFSRERDGVSLSPLKRSAKRIAGVSLGVSFGGSETFGETLPRPS